MTYAIEFYENFIKPRNIKSFTHRDILLNTDTNCPYSLLKHTLMPFLESLGYTIRVERESRINSKGQTKYFNRYYIEESK